MRKFELKNKLRIQPSLEHIKSHGFQFFIYTIILGACLSFPKIISYKFGLTTSACIAFIIFMMDAMQVSSKNATAGAKLRLYLKKYFLLAIIILVTVYVMGVLNQKLYGESGANLKEIHPIATTAGYLPNSDAALYLMGIHSFLEYGILSYNTIYRPIAHLLNAVLFKLAGYDLIHFFYLTSILLIISIVHFGKILGSNISYGIGATTSFFLIFYFSKYQATFLTELNGGMLGIFALSILISAYFNKTNLTFYLGLTLFSLAMQVRTGALFIAPILIIIYTFRRYGANWKKVLKHSILFSLVFTFGNILPNIQLKLLNEKSQYQSNISYYLYQIQTGSNKWNQVFLDHPEEFPPGTPYEITAKKAMNLTKEKFKNAPYDFLNNYFRKTTRSLIKPWKLLFNVFWIYNTFLGIFLLGCFMTTPLLYPIGSNIRILFWFIIAAIFGVYLSSPIVEEIWMRTVASTIGINTLILSVALYNICKILQLILSSSLNYSDRTNLKIRIKVTEVFKFDIMHPGNFKNQNSILVFTALVVILFIFISPIVVDKFRKPSIPHFSTMNSIEKCQDKQKFLLNPQRSKSIKIHAAEDFEIDNPKIISKSKLNINNFLCDTLSGRYYFFNAINLLSKKEKISGRPFILIPDNLVQRIDWGNPPILYLEGTVITPKKHQIFLVDRVQSISDLQ